MSGVFHQSQPPTGRAELGPRRAQDPDRESVYAAEETWEFEANDLGYLDDQPEWLTPETVSAFTLRVLHQAGWGTIEPTILFDVPNEHELAGWHSGSDRVIHLHPLLLSPKTVLHEVAHWLDNRDGHGPIFQANFVTLIEAAYGADASRLLFGYYVEHGLTPDPWRLPDWAEDLRRQSLHRESGEPTP